MQKTPHQQIQIQQKNLENAFDDELEVEDEDDDEQRRQRHQSLQNQDMIMKSYLNFKGNNHQIINKQFVLYRDQIRESNPEDFDNYFKKYNGSSDTSPKFVFIDDEEQDDIIKIEDEDSFDRNDSLQHLEERTVPKIMTIKLAKMKKYESNKLQYGIDEFETPTPGDEYHEFPMFMKNKSQPEQMIHSPISSTQGIQNKKTQSEKKTNENEQAGQKKNSNQIQISEFNTLQNYKTPQDFNTQQDNNTTPYGYNTPNQNFYTTDNGNKENTNNKFTKAYEEQQRYLQQQAQQNDIQQNTTPQGQKPFPMKPKMSFEQQRENSIKELLKTNNTEGYDEITPEQRQFFASNTFKEILIRGIIPDLNPNKDFYDNEHYLVITRDAKWNRVYLKKLNIKEQYSVYTESYKKIITKFIKYMPQTVYSDDKTCIVIQKLGDFSLYDLSNLILIEAKQHETVNYQKYYLQMLSNLFESLILILFHNYYIGNISSKNVFISKVQNQFVVKFSSLVDFSFDYTQICDKNYAFIPQQKPTEIEIWFSELYACCRCMQEMMDRDKYYLQKKNVKDFIDRHKGKYAKIMKILSFFLLRNDSTRNGINFDVIQQFILNSFQDSEKVIQLSDRSIKHIQFMIQTQKMHLSAHHIELNNKLIEQRLFFFIQQMHFHQDFNDEEMKYIIKFINRILYRHLFDKQQESDLFYTMLNILITDTSIFRRNKNLQKATYIIYILYLLKSPQKIDKCIAYWRHMSQTTSLIDQQNPISLYYVGIYNLFLTENQKALKYFQFSYQCKNYVEDIRENCLPNKPSRDLDDSDNEIDRNPHKKFDRNKSSAPISPITSNKQQNKNTTTKLHTLFSQKCEEDELIMMIREGYGYLGQLKYIFVQENNVKKMAQLIQEAKNQGIYGILEKLITLEIQITQNIKQMILRKSNDKNQSAFFAEQIASTSTFNMNTYQQTQKTISNNVTLTQNFKQQFQSYQSSEPILFQIWNLFLQQVMIQQQISDKVSDSKKNFSNDKARANSFSINRNIESFKAYPIDL